MDCTSHQFFSGACFSQQQDRGIARCNGFDLPENGADRRTIADDFREVHFAADLGFQIELFLCEFVLQIGDLTVRECVIDRNRNLLGDLAQEIDLVGGEYGLSNPPQIQ